jgi:uncharacterized protein (DUF1330 family)
MKTAFALALATVAGIAIGGVAVEGLRAQAKPPVYLIENNAVKDADGYMKQFLPLSVPTVKEHGGRVMAAGKGIAVEGPPPNNRVVIIRWDSLDQLMAWHNSADYQSARKIGDKYATFNSMAVEGMAQ